MRSTTDLKLGKNFGCFLANIEVTCGKPEPPKKENMGGPAAAAVAIENQKCLVRLSLYVCVCEERNLFLLFVRSLLLSTANNCRQEFFSNDHLLFFRWGIDHRESIDPI